jgi:hypothetical protein
VKPKKKGIGGRKADFNSRLVAGLNGWDASEVAALGKAATTEGGKLAKDFMIAAVGCNFDPGEESAKEMNVVFLRIWNAFAERRSKVFEEIAKYLAAEKKALGGSPTAEVVMHAANFVGFCLDTSRLSDFGPERRFTAEGGSNAMRAAWKKPRFMPSVAETLDYCSERMDPPPDYKTVERALKALGRKPRRKRR